MDEGVGEDVFVGMRANCSEYIMPQAWCIVVDWKRLGQRIDWNKSDRIWTRILVQVRIYRRLRIGRDGQSKKWTSIHPPTSPTFLVFCSRPIAFNNLYFVRVVNIHQGNERQSIIAIGVFQFLQYHFTPSRSLFRVDYSNIHQWKPSTMWCWCKYWPNNATIKKISYLWVFVFTIFYLYFVYFDQSYLTLPKRCFRNIILDNFPLTILHTRKLLKTLKNQFLYDSYIGSVFSPNATKLSIHSSNHPPLQSQFAGFKAIMLKLYWGDDRSALTHFLHWK